MNTNEKIEQEVDAVKQKIEKLKKERNLPEFSNYTFSKLEEFINSALKKLFPEINAEIFLDTPPTGIKGDLAFGVFALSKSLSKNPNEIAIKVVGYINNEKNELIEKVENVGPFINLFLNKSAVYQSVLKDFATLKDQYGESDINNGKTVFVDYSAPNIAKPMGVGHLRSTIIGQALANIYEATGYVAIKDNHLGDWGTQFGALIYAYEHWLDEKELEKDPIRHLKDLYVKFHEEEEKEPAIRNEARAIFAKLEAGDEKILALWEHFKDLSLKSFRKVYDRLGINFDLYIGESYFINRTAGVIEDAKVKSLVKADPDGALVVDITGLPTFLLQKQDGSSLYLTRDLASIKYRVETFNPDCLLYVVGHEQELHFKQLFSLARAIDYLKPETCARHIEFGLVLTGGKKMSTRKGTLVELEELLDEAAKRSKEIIESKNRDLTGKELDETAEKIGAASIIYNDLSHNRIKNISFDWGQMINFEAGSAVYLEYSYVRISSILNKLAQDSNFQDLKEFKFENKSEFDLASKLMSWPVVIARAQKEDAPNLICNFLEELAQIFNVFYENTSIKQTTDLELLKSRLFLIDMVSKTIKKGLGLLNIQTVERM